MAVVSQMRNLSTILFVLICCFLRIQTTSAVTATTCGGSATCTAVGGVLDGGRCFFFGTSVATWPNSWTQCASLGGTLAQLHTLVEINKVLTLARSKSIGAFYIAMQRNNGVSAPTCCITPTTTFWYDSSSVKNTMLMAQNTIARNYYCGDYDAGGEYCYSITVRASSFVFNDIPCSSTSRPLCQINVVPQTVTKTAKCLTETAILTLTATQPQDCSDACWQRAWCRSFNYRRNATNPSFQSCQLFSWSTADNPSSIAAPANGECVHYNYVP